MDQDRAPLLLADLRWLDALARRLARDPEVAADAVQETCAAALQHGGAVAHPRAWLATVLRNCLRLAHRGRTAASARERAVARPEAEAATDELVQRAELQQRLVGAVLRLPAPYRDAVLLRWFDDLPPRAIAARLGVPVATVHSRLQRGLQALRVELDRDCGGRAAWSLLLAPMPWPVVAATALGGIMQTNVKLALAVLALAGTVTWWWVDAARDEAAAAVAARGDRAAHGDAGGGAGGGGDALAASAAHERARVETPAAAPVAATATVQVRGRVCDVDNHPLANVCIAASGDDGAAVTSDAAGVFTATIGANARTFAVGDPRYVTVLAAAWAPETTAEPVVVAAPLGTFAGRVVDAQGGPVAGAQIAVQLPDDLSARLSLPLDRAVQQRWEVRTGDDGVFRLPRVPRIGGSTLFAGAPTFRPFVQPLPMVDDEQLQLVLQRFAFEAGQLSGVVVDPSGAPVPGALVTMGVTSCVSDGDGRFGVSLRRAGWPTAIVAVKAGWLPGRVEVPKSGGGKPEDWPERIVLRLGGKPLSLRGRVVDQDGKAIAGAKVWVSDPTLLGIVGILPMQMEYLLAGGAVPPMATRREPRFADDPTKDEMFIDQASNVATPNAAWFYVVADAQGEFEVSGLLPRDYLLRALDPQTGVTGDALPTPAGTFATIRITRQHVWPEVRGQVVSMRGEPMAGCRVEVHVLQFRTNERVPGGRFEGQALHEGAHTTTGADGTFVLRDVGSEHAFLNVSGDTILPRDKQCKDIAEPRQVRIEVEARCHVEVALASPAEADSITAADAQGRPVDLAVLQANSNAFETDLPLHDGKSGVFVLSERATKLLLRRGEVVVREVPLQLQPGKTLRVQ